MSSKTPEIESAEELHSGNKSTLERTLSSVMEVGRELLAKRRLPLPSRASSVESLVALCEELLEHRGEASGLALAVEISESYRQLTEPERLDFFSSLANDFDVDDKKIIQALSRYRSAAWIIFLSSTSKSLARLEKKSSRSGSVNCR